MNQNINEVPQVFETGVSHDYMNEYAPVAGFFDLGGIPELVKTLKRSPVKKYAERFSPDVYDQVVNNQNRERVARLDEIAEEVNTRYIDPNNFTEEEFKRTINEVMCLVYSEGHEHYKDV